MAIGITSSNTKRPLYQASSDAGKSIAVVEQASDPEGRFHDGGRADLKVGLYLKTRRSRLKGS
jgi:hypothetical protein